MTTARRIDEPGAPGRNVGHGHVHPRPDGLRVRCGGPATCELCRADAHLAASSGPTGEPTRVWALPDGRIAVRVAGLLATEPWLIVDQLGGTCIAHGELADDAVEITHRRQPS